MRTKHVVAVISIILCGAGMAVGQTEWIDDPGNPVIEPGPPGSWDEGGRSATSVLFDGSTYHMWFVGFNDEAEEIGHATSPDGVEWTMDPANPVLTRGEPGEWDQTLVGSAVIHDGTQFHMWYTAWDDDDHGRAGYATSPDGGVWTKHPGNPVMDVGCPGSWDGTAVGPGTVIVDGGIYKMWYQGGLLTATAYQTSVGFAESTDGISWTRRPDPILEPSEFPGAWDPGYVGDPQIIFDGGTYHMWYVGGEQSASTTAFSIGYAYSGDGIEWTKHRGNPVLQYAGGYVYRSPVVFDGSTFHMWYTHSDGATELIKYATSDCCGGVAGLNDWQFIPAAAVASGAQGAFFQTDVDVSNADSQAAEYQFMWLPRGEDNSEPATSETFSLGAGKSTRYANVLAEVFDLEPDSLGALAIKSTTPDLLAMSRTYNTPTDKAAGTYGQAIPAIRSENFIQSGERRRILFGSENSEMRTNVGCLNPGSRDVAVVFELYSADGTSLGRPIMVLDPLGNDQINRIFDGHNPVNGYVDVWTATPNRSFYCYGSVLDNVTSDPTTILPQ
jgi:hypothetical protein